MKYMTLYLLIIISRDCTSQTGYVSFRFFSLFSLPSPPPFVRKYNFIVEKFALCIATMQLYVGTQVRCTVDEGSRVDVPAFARIH